MCLLWVPNSVTFGRSMRHGKDVVSNPLTKHYATSKSGVQRRARVATIKKSKAILCMSTEYEKFNLQLVNVPNERYMLTPGEVRQVALDYSLFHAILQSGSTLFGCVNVSDWSSSSTKKPRGALLSILQVKNVVEEDGDGADAQTERVPKMMVEARCTCRFDVLAVSAGGDCGQLWKLMTGECSMVHDWSCWEITDRRALAELEWVVWQEVNQVASLMRKLETPGTRRIMMEQELAVWAPGKYDREILEEEWRQTPVATREVWCQRAESFSFGVLRCLECAEEDMRQARDMTNTLARFEFAFECLTKKKALTSAQLSLKNVLDDS